MNNRGYVTPGGAGLIVFLVLTAVFIIAIFVDYSKRADTGQVYHVQIWILCLIHPKETNDEIKENVKNILI